jgi:hypothetical protein
MPSSPEVATAIEESKRAFPACVVEVTDDGQGGAFVCVSPIDPGDAYTQTETWVGFQITFQYPYSDVYPHFVRGDLARLDGAGLGEGMSPASWQGRPAVQISRRSNHLDPNTDTAVLKLLKVLEWLRRR